VSDQTIYRPATVFLHWAIALFIISNIVLGHVMMWTPLSMRPVLMPLHTWIGLTVLLLTLARIAARLKFKKPAYPADYKTWELRLATACHLMFYVLMLGLPILGYLILSANPPHPTRHISFWSVGVVPYFEPLQTMARPAQKVVHDQFVAAHAFGAWLLVATLALHLAGVIKHQFLDGHDILRRMSVPMSKPESESES